MVELCARAREVTLMADGRTYREIAAGLIRDGEGQVVNAAAGMSSTMTRPAAPALGRHDRRTSHHRARSHIAGRGISPDEADAMLAEDLSTSSASPAPTSAHPFWLALDDVRRAVLMDMAMMGEARSAGFRPARDAMCAWTGGGPLERSRTAAISRRSAGEAGAIATPCGRGICDGD
jgi:hypothetical protein